MIFLFYLPLHVSVAVVVLPIPGGPDNRAHLKLEPFSWSFHGFFLSDPSKCHVFQFLSHLSSLLALLFSPICPIIFAIDFGLYLSTHSSFGSLTGSFFSTSASFLIASLFNGLFFIVSGAF